MKGYVQVYRNLHKSSKMGCPMYSIRNDKGKVERHSCTIMLTDCVMRVSNKGKQRVRDEKRKNVHAYIQGRRALAVDLATFYDNAVEITYDPYLYDTFVQKDTNEPIFGADCVIFGCGDRGEKVMATRDWREQGNLIKKSLDLNPESV